jgi:hypothetical protein
MRSHHNQAGFTDKKESPDAWAILLYQLISDKVGIPPYPDETQILSPSPAASSHPTAQQCAASSSFADSG